MTGEPLGEQRQRIDKWLFFARLVKSRALAQALVEGGFVSVNGQVITLPSRMIRCGDRIDLALENGDKRLVMRAPGERRGPYPEASRLYEDVSEPQARLSAFERAQRMVRPLK